MNLFDSLRSKITWPILVAAILFCGETSAQQMIVNLAPIDGVDITPDNVFNYEVQSNIPKVVQATITGVIHYRGSNTRMSYTFKCNIHQGMNSISSIVAAPQWTFSSSALHELFLNYKVMPSGTFEYCVTVVPLSTGIPGDKTGSAFDECMIHRSDDIFMINLLSPEDKAKLPDEFNPMLAWFANYSFSNDLQYRVKVAEIKQGQNAQNAITRNQPFFDQSNVMQSSITYPVYAKPLAANQWYAWTVDAYFKGLLLGSAETWKFIIPVDSSKPALPGSNAYIDIKLEKGAVQQYANGQLKLKYVLNDAMTDTLHLQLLDAKNKPVTIKPSMLPAVYGDNRFVLNLQDSCSLKHNASYTLKVLTNTNHNYTLPFKYANPEFVQ